MWIPSTRAEDGPEYRAIAAALCRDVGEGRLPPGTRLPTQRALAKRLGVTVGTVGRAYAEAQRLGVVSGEVGRGTFVRGAAPGSFTTAGIAEGARDGYVDLSLNFPSARGMSEPLRAALRALAARSELSSLLAYQPPAGAREHRAAGAEWIAASGLPTSPEQVVITTGAQHAMTVAFAALAQPGDAIACESLTYPGMLALARLLRLRLVGVALDDYGARPDAFDAVCRSQAPRALYCMPALHNPTGVVMPESRRRELAEIARRYDVALVEDDIHGFLADAGLARLSAFAPERSYYLTSLSKCVAPGLRIGYLRAPEQETERVAACVRSMTWMAPPVMAEIATLWIRDGSAREIAARRRHEARARSAMALRILGGTAGSPPEAHHLWLRLPEPWRATEFCEQARSRGVLVLPAEVFAVGRDAPPHAVRISLASPPTRSELERGLRTLAEVLTSPPTPLARVI